VVGYSAVAFFKPQSLKSEKWLSEEEEKELLKIARETLESYLSEGKIPHFEVKSESLKEEMGAFVTLKKKGRLRGCIGHVEANKPLYEVVSEMAITAATQDPRFSPVTLDELSEIDIEISVLSPLKKVNNIEEIKVGRDGLVIKKGFASGLLLPQVPVEWGWSREEFLRQVSLKAGLPPDAWKEADLYRFTAQVFGEKE
jgi:AmmeMemoRadiSam system protein A